MKEHNAKEKIEGEKIKKDIASVFIKVIDQLEDLKCHCQDMTRTVEIGEENIWEEDIKALNFAIAALRISSHNLIEEISDDIPTYYGLNDFCRLLLLDMMSRMELDFDFGDVISINKSK